MNPVYFAPPIFMVIAFIFSMLGMGGSQLYVPILFWLGMDFKTQAIPLGMLLNVVNSSTAMVIYDRKRLIDWKVALPFGAMMVIFAPLGTLANIHLPTKPVILVFAVFTAAAALLMLSGWKPKRGYLESRGRLILGVVGGVVLGFFAGLIGRGGGSFVVPLLYIVGLAPKVAIGTSSLVVTFSGSSSFISHLFTAARAEWGVWILCVASVFIGSQAGSRVMAAKLNPRSVKIVFGVVLLGVAGLLIVKDVFMQ